MNYKNEKILLKALIKVCSKCSFIVNEEISCAIIANLD